MTNKLVSSNFIGGKCQYLKVWDKVLFQQTSIEGSVIYPKKNIYIYIYKILIYSDGRRMEVYNLLWLESIRLI